MRKVRDKNTYVRLLLANYFKLWYLFNIYIFIYISRFYRLFYFFQDVLENEQIKLDWMFRYSLMQDIVRVSKNIFNVNIRKFTDIFRALQPKNYLIATAIIEASAITLIFFFIKIK